MSVRVRGDLRGRGAARRESVAEGQVHDVDLLLLRDDDLLGQPLQALVLAVAELDDRHVDGALVVGDHHAREVAVSIAGEGHVHRRVHACSCVAHHRAEGVSTVVIQSTVGIRISRARSRRQCEHQKSNEAPVLHSVGVHVEDLPPPLNARDEPPGPRSARVHTP